GSLQASDQVRLLTKWSEELVRRVKQRRGIEIRIDSAPLATLARRSKELGEGAAALQRLFLRGVENRLAQIMLADQLEEGSGAELVIEDDQLTWHPLKKRRS